MATATKAKVAPKATPKPKLNAAIFEAKDISPELIKQAYVAYLANGRLNLAKTKTRGDVSGGGKKPWRQKGTGRARFGSSRNPIWKGGGVAFGPTGSENYSHKLGQKAKHQAIIGALTLANQSGKIVVESFVIKDGKTSTADKLISKLNAKRNILIVAESKDEATSRSLQNLTSVKYTQAKYLNVFDVMNADHIIVDQKALDVISEWLVPAKVEK